MSFAGEQAGLGASEEVAAKLDEFFWEWLCTPEAQKIVKQALQYAKGDNSARLEAALTPSPHFSAVSRARPGPSPPGSPHSRALIRESLTVSDSGSSVAHSDSSVPGSPVQQPRDTPSLRSLAGGGPAGDSENRSANVAASGTAKVIPRFWRPKRQKPQEELSLETRRQIHDIFVRQNMTEIRTYRELDPIVTEVFGLSTYVVIPIFNKIKAFYGEQTSTKAELLAASSIPITEHMLMQWCGGRMQVDDPVLSFFSIVKKDHNNWIEREDFSIFLSAILLTHPGLDFLPETSEFQERYADTVISRIFFVYDQKDIGRIYLPALRRYKPSLIDAWKTLAEHDDIKMVRDYFSYEHFYVIYCTFWELDSDNDFLLDKDDLLKYDGHAMSRRAVDRIFSEIPAKFTSAVPGKMGYDDFIRFLLCDQDRQTDRSIEYWFSLLDLDGDGFIKDYEMKYFYDEQVQRMECLNYETISFADIMCQMNDMVWPKIEGQFQLKDFKRRRRFAGTFFSVLSSLPKFLTFEHRDPFQAKQDQLDNPSCSEWDRWCADEYLRLAMEEGEEPDEEH